MSALVYPLPELTIEEVVPSLAYGASQAPSSSDGDVYTNLVLVL